MKKHTIKIIVAVNTIKTQNYLKDHELKNAFFNFCWTKTCKVNKQNRLDINFNEYSQIMSLYSCFYLLYIFLILRMK